MPSRMEESEQVTRNDIRKTGAITDSWIVCDEPAKMSTGEQWYLCDRR